MKPKTKPMKPVRAWAAVDGKGKFVDGNLNRRIAELRNPGYRIARVEIREVARVKKSH